MSTFAPKPDEIDTGAGGPKWFPWVCETCGRCWWYRPGEAWVGPLEPCCYAAWKVDTSLGHQGNPMEPFVRALSRMAFERGRVVGRAEAKAEKPEGIRT